MKPVVALCCAPLLVLAVTGCVYVDGKYAGEDHDDWRSEQRDNRAMISRLDVGMERSAVLERLGTPADSEAFDLNGEEVRVLFYRTQRTHSDGNTTRDETTPLVFRNDLLVGWGQAVYEELRY